MRATLEAPAGFSFRYTLYSHGWYSLPPFRVAGSGGELETTMALPDSGACTLRLRPRGAAVVLQSDVRAGAGLRRRIVAAGRRILNLDLDLGEFHDSVRGEPELAWIAEAGAGRLLRSPDVWEDLVKLVLTTNCSWALTTRMVTALTELFGEAAPGGARAFPRAEALARATEARLRDRAKLGYRAPFVLDLARRVADGRVDPGAWEGDRRPTRELRAEILELPGVGPYVAENLLRFLGRPAGLGLDSWLRAKYSRVYHGGRPIKDRTIERRYRRYERWAGLALWCDMTRDWFDGDDPPIAPDRAMRRKS